MSSDSQERFRQARKDGWEAALSLALAINEAGGSLSCIKDGMTLEEFIYTVAAQNGIRFCYEGPKPEESLPRVREAYGEKARRIADEILALAWGDDIMREAEGVMCGVHVDNYRKLLEKAEELARLVKEE